MKVLVIGGAGVTGTAIVRQLLARGCDVSILHRGVHHAPHPTAWHAYKPTPTPKTA
jgi:uncharacterized protein YbjT (DUF2867 family)